MKKYLLIVLLVCTVGGCENINYLNPVPQVPVNYTLNITQEYPHFVPAAGYQTMTITHSKFEKEYIGYSGLLIWIAMDGNYYAADLCCPNCVMKKPVEIDGLYAVCPKCGEHYDLSYGYAFPTKGFTQYPLRKYPTILYNNASGYSLRITN